MVSWVLIAVVIVFPLIQVPAVIYIGKYCRLKEGETPGRPDVRNYWLGPEGEDRPGTDAERDANPEVVDPVPDAIQCPSGGTENTSKYRYCGECASSLHRAD
jgi:hypothetical protein